MVRPLRRGEESEGRTTKKKELYLKTDKKNSEKKVTTKLEGVVRASVVGPLKKLRLP